MSDLSTTRRHVLALGLAVPALTIPGRAASASTCAQARIGAVLLAEQGYPAGAALLATNRSRLAAVDTYAIRLTDAVAADFRARRTVAVGGVLLAEMEAAACVRSALDNAR